MVNFVKFLLIQHFFWYFIPQYLVNCCSDPYKTYYFLKEHDEVFQMDINKLLWQILDILLRSAQICKKCTIFGNLMTITREGKKETKQMNPFFSPTFWVLTICNNFVFEKCQNSFSWGPLLGKNLVPFDSGNIHNKESKEPGFTFSIKLRTKFVWSHGLH